MRTDPSKRIPTSADTSEIWITWHKSLKKWFRKNEANEHWLRFWNQRGGAGSDADTIDLREYMESQDVKLTTTVMGDIADGTKGVVDYIGETINWGRGLIIGGVVIGIGLIAFYFIYNTTKGKTAAEMTAGMPVIGRRRRLAKMGVRSSTIPAQSVAPIPPVDINSIDFTSANATKLLT